MTSGSTGSLEESELDQTGNWYDLCTDWIHTTEVSGSTLGSINVKLLSDHIIFLSGLYSPLSDSITITGYVWSGFSMSCCKIIDYRLYRSIYCESIDSACFGHNTHHCNIRPVSNWFVEARIVVGENKYAVYFPTNTWNW